MALDPGTYDVEFLQNAEVQSTGEFTLDGTANLARMQFAITTADFGISPSSNASTNHTNLQNFIDHCADNDLTGVIEAGDWEVDDTLRGKNGLRLMGRGMNMTYIHGEPDTWAAGSNNFSVFRIDTSDNGGNLIDRGLYLADMRFRSADRTRADTGGACVRIQATSDGLVERLRVEDASSYGLFVSGYGAGDFTNDISDPFWNAARRFTVRDCLFLRGQIGAGTEGGMENVLFQRCTAIGNFDTSSDSWGLHAYRSASGRQITFDKCVGMAYRNCFLLDRYQHMHYNGCYMNCRNGIAMGGYSETFGDDTHEGNAHDVRITNNFIHSIPEPNNSNSPIAIQDNFITSNRTPCDGLVISGNVIQGGYMAIRRSKQVVIFGNVSRNSGDDIQCSSSATGLVFGNLMNLSNSASGITDGGNNGFVSA